jgi:hypothetical protein
MTILQPFFHGLFGIGIVRICEMFFILVLDLFIFLTTILCSCSNLCGPIVKSSHKIIIFLFYFIYNNRDLSIWPRFCNVENSVMALVYSWELFPS